MSWIRPLQRPRKASGSPLEADSPTCRPVRALHSDCRASNCPEAATAKRLGMPPVPDMCVHCKMPTWAQKDALHTCVCLPDDHPSGAGMMAPRGWHNSVHLLSNDKPGQKPRTSYAMAIIRALQTLVVCSRTTFDELTHRRLDRGFRPDRVGHNQPWFTASMCYAPSIANMYP